MLAILVPVLGLAAIGAWIVALVSAVGLWRRVPPDHRLKGLLDPAWLQFDTLPELVGPELQAHSKRYVWALVVFFVTVAALVAIMVVIVVSGQNSA